MKLPETRLMIILFTVILFSILENIFSFYKTKQTYKERVFANFILGIFNSLILNISIVIILFKITENPPFFSGIFSLYDFGIWTFILSFLILDLYMYSWHRIIHSWPLAWRFHEVHHCDLAMNSTSSFRFHIIESFFSKIPQLFLIWFFGITLIEYFVYDLVFVVIVIFQHSNVALPYSTDKFLSTFIVTPNFHRIHHSQEIEETNSNYSSVFSIWDHLFSSFRWNEKPEDIKIGLKEHTTKKDTIELITMPFNK